MIGIPSILFLFVLLLSPRTLQEKHNNFSRTQPFSRNEYEKAVDHGNEHFAVVVDAGSTGSRVHILKFVGNSKDALELKFDKFDQLKPGLSAYADEPHKAALSLKSLLDLALETIPAKLHASTPIMIGATAGLRLLPDGKADQILDEVRHWVRSNYPFKLEDEDVKILSGVNEGAFAWLTLNYLLGNLGQPYSETVAAIDLGGGSVQEAYAMSQSEVEKAPHSDYVTKLRGGGQEYNVYVHSYLGYGLMAGRAAVLSEDPNGPEDPTHPCVHRGFTGKYEYGGNTFEAVGHEDGAEHDQCASTVLSALKLGESCGAPEAQCSFNGAWGGPRLPDSFYVSSYFFDRAIEAGVIGEKDAIQATIDPTHFKRAAEEICPLHVESIAEKYPDVQEEHRPYFCLDLTYAHVLLTSGFKIPNVQELTLVKRVEYQGEIIEAAWPLGAAINMLG